MPKLSYILTSLIIGGGVAFTIQINAVLGSRIGSLESAFVAHFLGTITSLILLFFNFGKGNLWTVNQLPFILLTGGIIGVGIVTAANSVIPKLGMANAISLFITGQLLFSLLCDHFGWLNLPTYPITSIRILGAFFLGIGIFLVLKK